MRDSIVAPLLSKKLIFVTGKGGVGKSTVSLALALYGVQHGKKVMLAEVHANSSDIQEKKEYIEKEIIPGLHTFNIIPQKAFQEYVLMQIKFETLYNAVFENKIMKNFIEATPGLGELMCIGKVYELTSRYDWVIVDAPATGHGLAMLEMPTIVSSAVGMGPLKTESDKIHQLLTDETKTSLVLVTLPEELPVSETIDLYASLKKKIPLHVGGLILNQFREPFLTSSQMKSFQEESDSKHAVWDIVYQGLNEVKRSQDYLEKLEKEFPELSTIPLPFLYTSSFGLPEAERLSQRL